MNSDKSGNLLLNAAAVKNNKINSSSNIQL